MPEHEQALPAVRLAMLVGGLAGHRGSWASSRAPPIPSAPVVGIRHFAMVHDSYGTHACNTGILRDVLRAVAADFYSVDRLAEFDAFVRSYAPAACELPERPALGSFDTEEVREAPFFFS